MWHACSGMGLITPTRHEVPGEKVVLGEVRGERESSFKQGRKHLGQPRLDCTPPTLTHNCPTAQLPPARLKGNFTLRSHLSASLTSIALMVLSRAADIGLSPGRWLKAEFSSGAEAFLKTSMKRSKDCPT